VFLKKGAAAAAKSIDRPDLSKTLKEAALAQLAQALSEGLVNISLSQSKEIEKDPTSETNRALLGCSQNEI
jgi:hypothetical protein